MRTTSKLNTVMLPLDVLDGHPCNPRPLSERWGMRVVDENVERLAALIAANGFDESQPIKVKAKPDGRYFILRGHHQACACRLLEHESILAVIDNDADEADSMLSLTTEQSLEPAPHLRARLSWEMIQGQALMSVAEYSRRSGLSEATIQKHLKAWAVVLHCGLDQEVGQIPVLTMAEIARLEQRDWGWVCEFVIANRLKRQDVEKVVKTLLQVDIPEEYSGWMPRLPWMKRAAADSLNKKQKPRVLNDITRWCKEARSAITALQHTRKLNWKGEPENVSEQLVDQFHAGLSLQCRGDRVPSQTIIQRQMLLLRDGINDHNEQMRMQLRLERAVGHGDKPEDIQQEVELRLARKLLELEPIGNCCDVRDLTDWHPPKFDAIITDPPYLLSNGGMTVRSGRQAIVDKNFQDSRKEAITPSQWIPFCIKHLRVGGVLAFTCTEHIYLEAVNTAKALGLELIQTMYWIKASPPPLLHHRMLTPSVEMIPVLWKPTLNSQNQYYCGSREYREAFTEKLSHFKLKPPYGDEVLGVNDTQKPLTLARRLITAWVPPGGRMLDPFAGSGTFPLAAKMLQRQCEWIEIDKAQFDVAQSRTEEWMFDDETLKAMRRAIVNDVTRERAKAYDAELVHIR